MKTKGWFLITVLLLVGTASRSLGAETPPSLQESFTQLERAIQTNKEAASAAKNLKWPEIERLQTSLWRAMALDPSVIAPVPAQEVPRNLFAAELNAEILKQLEEVKKSTLPKSLGIEAEFSQYLLSVQDIMNLRKSRQFPQARAIAKRGILDSKFEPISKKIAPETSSSVMTDAWMDVDESLKTMKDQVSVKDAAKKELFNSGNQFIWYACAALFGFMLGLGAFRLNPNFFQKFVETLDSSVPSATTHSVGNQKLDYSRWLREFEEILSRLKSSQLSHERRIEDLVSSSEKISQQIAGLAGDARIKNEASLEYRMTSVLRSIHGQLDLGHKLQGGDRVQINLMLEHCLNLCDAIETGAIHYHRGQDDSAPSMKSA